MTHRQFKDDVVFATLDQCVSEFFGLGRVDRGRSFRLKLRSFRHHLFGRSCRSDSTNNETKMQRGWRVAA